MFITSNKKENRGRTLKKTNKETKRMKCGGKETRKAPGK